MLADLAVMAATLASGGTNPLSGERVFSRVAARQVLSVMLTCGMYDNAGDWVSDVGIPAKSGVGGGIIAVVPGQLAVATVMTVTLTCDHRVVDGATGARFLQAFKPLIEDPVAMLA